MLARMWSKRDSHPLLVEVQTHIAIVEISVVVSRKLETDLPQDAAISVLGIYEKGTPCSNPEGHMLTYIHNSIVCTSQEVKTT